MALARQRILRKKTKTQKEYREEIEYFRGRCFALEIRVLLSIVEAFLADPMMRHHAAYDPLCASLTRVVPGLEEILDEMKRLAWLSDEDEPCPRSS